MKGLYNASTARKESIKTIVTSQETIDLLIKIKACSKRGLFETEVNKNGLDTELLKKLGYKLKDKELENMIKYIISW